ncbi:MAG: PEP-CTERM sorting domain-containing protein [Chromatiales bacterium]|nr:PEP-CTERM sorting domain-containing protein [Gammaproteobacteria bacterium]MCP5352099.1 PEP-CTERM sorting domain-containing protein [Chromatiales bacterium]
MFKTLGAALVLALSWVSIASAGPLAAGNWNQIARIADDAGGMFDGNGNLLSTYSYGTKTANALTQNSDFQIAFDVYDTMEILFITGNEEVWGKTSYADLRAVIDAFAGNLATTNIQFDARVNGVEQTTQGNVLSRSGFAEDPWISLLGNHFDGVNNGNILWGENNYVGSHTALKEANGGINVFVSVQTSVPAPASLALLAVGLIGLGRHRRLARA